MSPSTIRPSSLDVRRLAWRSGERFDLDGASPSPRSHLGDGPQPASCGHRTWSSLIGLRGEGCGPIEKSTVIPMRIRGCVRLAQEWSGTNFEEGSDQPN